MDKPSVGRIVHYVAFGTPGGEFPAGVCRAAVITEVYTVNGPNPAGWGGILTVNEGGFIEEVGLCVLNPTGQFFNRGIPHNADKKPGTWHWPERVEPAVKRERIMGPAELSTLIDP